MGYDSKGILVFNLKYEHAIGFTNGDHSPIFPPGGVAVPTVVRKTFVF